MGDLLTASVPVPLWYFAIGMIAAGREGSKVLRWMAAARGRWSGLGTSAVAAQLSTTVLMAFVAWPLSILYSAVARFVGYRNQASVNEPPSPRVIWLVCDARGWVRAHSLSEAQPDAAEIVTRAGADPHGPFFVVRYRRSPE